MNWPMYRRVERQATRLHEMLERLDVDVGTLARSRNGDVYAEARSICLFCGSSDKCLRWLEGHSQAEVRPDFCPNLHVFEACKKVHSEC